MQRKEDLSRLRKQRRGLMVRFGADRMKTASQSVGYQLRSEPEVFTFIPDWSHQRFLTDYFST